MMTEPQSPEEIVREFLDSHHVGCASVTYTGASCDCGLDQAREAFDSFSEQAHNWRRCCTYESDVASHAIEELEKANQRISDLESLIDRLRSENKRLDRELKEATTRLGRSYYKRIRS